MELFRELLDRSVGRFSGDGASGELHPCSVPLSGCQTVGFLYRCEQLVFRVPQRWRERWEQDKLKHHKAHCFYWGSSCLLDENLSDCWKSFNRVLKVLIFDKFLPVSSFLYGRVDFRGPGVYCVSLDSIYSYSVLRKGSEFSLLQGLGSEFWWDFRVLFMLYGAISSSTKPWPVSALWLQVLDDWGVLSAIQSCILLAPTKIWSCCHAASLNRPCQWRSRVSQRFVSALLPQHRPWELPPCTR